MGEDHLWQFFLFLKAKKAIAFWEKHLTIYFLYLLARAFCSWGWVTPDNFFISRKPKIARTGGESPRTIFYNTTSKNNINHCKSNSCKVKKQKSNCFLRKTPDNLFFIPRKQKLPVRLRTRTGNYSYNTKKKKTPVRLHTPWQFILIVHKKQKLPVRLRTGFTQYKSL